MQENLHHADFCALCHFVKCLKCFVVRLNTAFAVAVKSSVLRQNYCRGNIQRYLITAVKINGGHSVFNKFVLGKVSASRGHLQGGFPAPIRSGSGRCPWTGL